MTRVSIVVNNYQYEAYVVTAIESCLAQSWHDVETVVVDDGSTDGSRSVCAPYVGRVSLVEKANGGQASAFAAGLAASTGQVVIFLDADDVLLPTAAEEAVRAFLASPETVKLSWPMWEIDEHGTKTGGVVPQRELPVGDLKDVVITQGADCYLSAPTSGNAWSRRFLERVLPAPDEEGFRRGADGYLITLAPLFGLVAAVPVPQSCYRLHPRNGFWKPSLEARVRGALQRHDVRARALADVLAREGLDSPASRAANPYVEWLHRLDRVIAVLHEVLPSQGRFLLLDGAEWGEQLLADRAHVPFTERDGVYWGPPQDDDAAVAELRRQIHRGIHDVVVGWPAFWWLEAYPSLQRLLQPVVDTEDVKVFRVLHRGS